MRNKQDNSRFKDKTSYSSCNAEINSAKSDMNVKEQSTNPRIAKAGYLGMDTLNDLRRRNIK